VSRLASARFGRGVSAGVGALWACDLWTHPSVTVEGVTVARVVAAAVSLAATSLLLQLLHAPHVPAGATTLLVSLGLLKSGRAVLAICAIAGVIALNAIVTVYSLRHKRQVQRLLGRFVHPLEVALLRRSYRSTQRYRAREVSSFYRVNGLPTCRRPLPGPRSPWLS
jgi:EamA domain-containing membrane protein RarD